MRLKNICLFHDLLKGCAKSTAMGNINVECGDLAIHSANNDGCVRRNLRFKSFRIDTVCLPAVADPTQY